MTQMRIKTQAATVITVCVHQKLCVMTRGPMRSSYVFVAQIHACIYVTTQSVVTDRICDRCNYKCEIYFIQLYDITS